MEWFFNIIGICGCVLGIVWITHWIMRPMSHSGIDYDNKMARLNSINKEKFALCSIEELEHRKKDLIVGVALYEDKYFVTCKLHPKEEWRLAPPFSKIELLKNGETVQNVVNPIYGQKPIGLPSYEEAETFAKLIKRKYNPDYSTAIVQEIN